MVPTDRPPSAPVPVFVTVAVRAAGLPPPPTPVNDTSPDERPIRGVPPGGGPVGPSPPPHPASMLPSSSAAVVATRMLRSRAFADARTMQPCTVERNSSLLLEIELILRRCTGQQVEVAVQHDRQNGDSLDDAGVGLVEGGLSEVLAG